MHASVAEIVNCSKFQYTDHRRKHMKYILAYSALLLGLQEGFTPRTIVIIAFALWSVPLTWLRTRFRKMVYSTDDWKIILKPAVAQEVKVLFGVTPAANRKTLLQYRWYLLGFLVIYATYKVVVV